MAAKLDKSRFTDVSDVVKWRLCLGCGACEYACPEKKIKLINFIDQGIRPVVLPTGDCSGCSDCVTVCPGVGVSHDPMMKTAEGVINMLTEGWGPVLEIWEGHATDKVIRFDGSSGGLASALALYCIENEGMRGVVHVGNDSEEQYKNKSTFSRTRDDILATTGSRYSPASPCDLFQAIEDAEGACVFIGKPCDLEGLRKTQSIRPGLSKNIGVAIGIFCAGTPSTQGTVDLLAKYGISHEDVEELRYRGRGWPGSFSVRLKSDSEWLELATYEEAWNFLQAYRPYRCHVCPDGTSEFADISCGDPWYRSIDADEPGKSLVLVRSEKGREIVKGAIKAGYIQLTPVEPEILERSQKELLRKRGAIWGRVTTMKTLGIPAPHFQGFSLLQNWLKLSSGQKIRSILGTAKRVITRNYFRPL
ncbi:Coenzyme F420 hydrogenase/dehydrogenase, beta subunit C-terminal domain [Methylobacter sp.]|uniref:Coenzyme F420 hydrogenase/dehydrogenase, beta subunit C-terminal domain n=1 Tax=Methylobacter sp. TaxID=2051955 RepID=UPI00248A6DEE|nr:Coenzyme F420 hydrogenase/dehydrogenase, beta subunit C-terminal domain [Methylobacter sp.]MDI1276377.1 Coenzyme F420 hydrogenase/dehydrogenase, beta subunit C-terminal domain [Methylobacter sp.]MDI1357117.1 Coenzyme F420 hydrogenase/dehydrogenase, beta subunit C-terminal domain [Methylobacter sp.]